MTRPFAFPVLGKQVKDVPSPVPWGFSTISFPLLLAPGSVGGDFWGGLEDPLVSQSLAHSFWVVFYSSHASLFLSPRCFYPLDSTEVVVCVFN